MDIVIKVRDWFENVRQLLSGSPTYNRGAEPVCVSFISVRTRTSASVNWRPEPWDVAGERSVRQRTPNLAALIHEVVNRPDWREGNALVLLISGSGRREAVPPDQRPSVFLPPDAWVGPRLYIELAEARP